MLPQPAGGAAELFSPGSLLQLSRGVIMTVPDRASFPAPGFPPQATGH